MPLARILTRNPEQAGALSNELRQHGYTVEFSNPESAGKPPADLEIDFEICAEPDALSRAAELADNLHTDVAVSPGVLVMPKPVTPVAEELDENPAEQVTAGSFARNNDVTVQGPPLAALEEIAPVEERVLEAEPVEPMPLAAMKNVSEMDADLPASTALEEVKYAQEPQMHDPEIHDSRVDGSQMEEETAIPEVTLPADMLAESVEEQHPHSFMQPAATAFDDEVEIARAASPSHTDPGEKNQFLAHAGEKSAAALESATDAGKEIWSAARERTQDLWMTVRERSAEYRERLRVMRAEREAERQYKLLQLEKRRESAEQRAVELEGARQAAAARLQALLRERGALTEAQPAPPQRIEVPVVITPAPRAEKPAWRRVFQHKITIPFSRTYRPEVEAVLMGVAAACAFVVLGLAVASFHARPAISGSFKQPATSANGVTVQSGGVTLKAGTPATPVSQRVAQPAPVRTQAVAQKPAPAVHQPAESDVTVRHFPTAAKPNPARESGSKNVADDVVIRHFGTQQVTPPAQQTAPQAGLKHYSDLDNQ